MSISYTLRLLMGVSSLSVALMMPLSLSAQEPPVVQTSDTPPADEGALETIDSIALDADVSLDDAADTPPEQEELTSLNEAWSGSLMFPDEMASGMMQIYREYLRRQQMSQPQNEESTTARVPTDVGRIITDMIPGEEPKEIPEEVLKLSLNSIVYEAPSDWSIWVNGQRYNREEAMEGFSIDRSDIKVVRATSDRVTYLWTPIAESFDKVQRRWQEKEELGENFVSPQAAQQDQVDFNEEAKTVTITMRPNQTFISQFMTVMEGVNAIRAIKAVAPRASEIESEGEGGEDSIPLSTQDEFVPAQEQGHDHNHNRVLPAGSD